MPNLEISLPRPAPDETYERYAIRAHRALMKLITDPEERNELVQDMYQQFRGATAAEKVAERKLSPDQFDIKKNVCLFCEHETTDQQGKQRKYGLPEMVKIVRNSNERIADMGSFAAISDGHTGPDKEPEILGYVGNYRLGMIGSQKPKWAIFADEYRLRDKMEKLKGKPRRSVELWTFKNSGKMHFDPIAALGSEAPRLALPLQFSQEGEGEAAVEHYSYVSQYAIPAPRDPIAEEKAAAGTVEPPSELEDYELPAAQGGVPAGDIMAPPSMDVPGIEPAEDIAAAPSVDVPDIESIDAGTYELPSETADVSPEKARKILEDGHVNGKPLTEKQRGMFGAIAGQGAEDYEAAEIDEYPDPPEQNTFPAGGNTFVKKFEQGEEAQPQRFMLSQEDMAQIVGAITELPHFKYLEKMMAEEESAALEEDLMADAENLEADEELPDYGDEDLEGEMPGAEPGAEAMPDEVPAALPEETAPPQAEGEEAEEEYAGAAAEEADEDLVDIQDLLIPEEEEEEMPMQASAETARDAVKTAPDAELVGKYSQLQASHNKLIRQHGALTQKVQQLERERADAHRKNKLQELSINYPDMVQLDEEFQTCLYSAGAQMDDEGFKAHVATIEKYASRAPQAPAVMVPGGVAPTGADASTERYEAQLSATAVRICTDAADRGEQLSWDEGLAQARDQLQPAG